MVKIDINGKEYYYDGILSTNLELLREAVKKKWDGVIYVGGYEGDGKSVLAEQLAFYLDHSYNIDRCVFTPEQFMQAVDEAKPFQAIVYDEAQDAFESTNRDSLTKAVKSKMTRIRKKQLYIFIVAPDFWRINKYLFIHRSRAFIRVYAEGLERGFFAFYNREKKHSLMIKGRKNEQLVVSPNFRGRFTKWRVLDEEEYEEKKDKATESIGQTNQCPSVSEKELNHRALVLLNWLSINNWLKPSTLKALSNELGMNYHTFRYWRKGIGTDLTVLKSLDHISDERADDLVTNILKETDSRTSEGGQKNDN